MTYKLIYLARRNPATSRDDWPRGWRSHAVFASRLPALEANFAYIRYCSRLDAPAALASLSTAHDGVAVVAGDSFRALDSSTLSEADRARLEQDELRVFDRPVAEFSFYCTEAVLRDGPAGEAALFRFLARKPGSSRDDFDIRWDGDHARRAQVAIARCPGITRYVHDRPVHEPLPDFPFDGISECWFATTDDALRAVENGELGEIASDLAEFCDPAASIAMLTKVCHRWPRD